MYCEASSTRLAAAKKMSQFSATDIASYSSPSWGNEAFTLRAKTACAKNRESPLSLAPCNHKSNYRRASTVKCNSVIEWCEKNQDFLSEKSGSGAR